MQLKTNYQIKDSSYFSKVAEGRRKGMGEMTIRAKYAICYREVLPTD